MVILVDGIEISFDMSHASSDNRELHAIALGAESSLSVVNLKTDRKV